MWKLSRLVIYMLSIFTEISNIMFCGFFFSMCVVFSLQLVFEGVVGNGFSGDIAIDDITVAPGPCGGDGKQ